jgi:hypothetical protein
MPVNFIDAPDPGLREVQGSRNDKIVTKDNKDSMGSILMRAFASALGSTLTNAGDRALDKGFGLSSKDKASTDIMNARMAQEFEMDNKKLAQTERYQGGLLSQGQAELDLKRQLAATPPMKADAYDFTPTAYPLPGQPFGTMLNKSTGELFTVGPDGKRFDPQASATATTKLRDPRQPKNP